MQEGGLALSTVASSSMVGCRWNENGKEQQPVSKTKLQSFWDVVLTHGHQATASISCQGELTPDSHSYHWSSFFWGFYLLRLTSLWSSSQQILNVWLSFLWSCKHSTHSYYLRVRINLGEIQEFIFAVKVGDQKSVKLREFKFPKEYI